ncbi:MAG: hypothetical protein A2234_04670 [Elusimicrobia bacterium RIFOXYA2_FULL_58_8]|nr:MAG: hypothetical protein A2234_04670 [Elusimicrobia bacterium RIFOXYA2_FULL_58_8]OGS14004.1 MAG: hypothetical protein A2285_02795 [Elusimicrobia bacterium RIFOXYA12_FULL_57_11]
MKHQHFLPFFLVLAASYLGLHFYAARWLIKHFSLPSSPAAWLRAAFLMAAFFAPFTMYLKRQWHTPALEPLYTAGYAWMGVILLAAFIFACSDLAGLVARRTGATGDLRVAQAAITVFFLTLAWAFYCGLKAPDIKHITLAFKDLPPALEGYKIAQVSDMHIDSQWKLRRFSALIEKINSAAPDLVVITGDLIDPGITCLENPAALTAKIQSRHGVFGSPGNHEYYYGLERALACYKAFGITPLVNEAADLADLRLIGLGDIRTENASETDVKNLLLKYKTGKFTIILSHQPLYYPSMAETGNYLVLSGHTHKGQIFPFHILTKLFYRHFYGTHRIKESVFHVTSGAGTWGPPMRWLAPAEIPLITLTRLP